MVINLKERRQSKKFDDELESIEEQPYIEAVDEIVNRHVIYPKDSRISVKYEPVFGQYILSVDIDSKEEVQRLAEAMREHL